MTDTNPAQWLAKTLDTDSIHRTSYVLTSIQTNLQERYMGWGKHLEMQRPWESISQVESPKP